MDDNLNQGKEEAKSAGNSLNSSKDSSKTECNDCDSHTDDIVFYGWDATIGEWIELFLTTGTKTSRYKGRMRLRRAT